MCVCEQVQVGYGGLSKFPEEVVQMVIVPSLLYGLYFPSLYLWLIGELPSIT